MGVGVGWCGRLLGSEVVLSPVVSACLPSCGGWVLVGVVGFLGSEVVLSPVVSLVSGCLPSCGGWVLVGVVGFLGSEVSCLLLSPIVSGCLLHVGGVLVGVVGCLGSEVVLSPVVSGCLPSCGEWVLVGVAASWALSGLVSRCLPLSPVVSFMWGGCWLVWPPSWL